MRVSASLPEALSTATKKNFERNFNFALWIFKNSARRFTLRLGGNAAADFSSLLLTVSSSACGP